MKASLLLLWLNDTTATTNGNDFVCMKSKHNESAKTYSKRHSFSAAVQTRCLWRFGLKYQSQSIFLKLNMNFKLYCGSILCNVLFRMEV